MEIVHLTNVHNCKTVHLIRKYYLLDGVYLITLRFLIKIMEFKEFVKLFTLNHSLIKLEIVVNEECVLINKAYVRIKFPITFIVKHKIGAHFFN